MARLGRGAAASPALDGVAGGLVGAASGAVRAARPAADATSRTPLDEPELNALYARLARPLRAYLRRLTGNPELADDLLQESFYRFLRSAPAALDERQTSTYLYRTATRLVQDGWRLRSRERERAGALPAEATTTPADGGARVDVERAFRDLKPRERALLWLAHVEDAPHREIAEVLGLGEASVKVLLFRARRKMARALDRHGVTEEDLR